MKLINDFIDPFFSLLPQSVDMDPCLDDCIEMAKKLKRLGIPVGLDVLPGLPHGFLSFVKVNSFINHFKLNTMNNK